MTRFPAAEGDRVAPLGDVDVFRILLVEDSRGDSILIAEALRDRDGGAFEVERSISLADALKRVATDRFDAVLLDLGLPDSQGFDTVTAMVAATPAPVLVLTGLDDEAVGLQAVRHGAQDYLVKGRATDEVLRRSLRYAIERARLRAATSSPLIETAPVGLAIFDRDLRFLYVNPAMAEMNGVPAVVHLGRRIDGVVPEMGVDAFNLLKRAADTGEPVREVEISGLTPARDETATWLLSCEPLRDASGTTVGLTASMVDITERKRKEEALAALAELRLQAHAIGELIAYGIWICAPDGGLEYASPSFLELVGMTMDQARRLGWTSALALDAIEPMLEAWDACRACGGEWEYEHVVRGVDGRWHTLLSRGLAVRDDSGRITSWAGINLDITERKEADAFRDAFIGVLSHELRTPITSIYGASTLLRRPAIEATRRKELVADIGEEAERLRRLVEDLLVLARAERGGLQVETEPVLLPHIVPRVVADERRRWSGHRFDLSMTEHLPVAAGDEALIEQVLRNLISNAAKYGPADGRIEVVVEALGGRPRIRVLDEGPGIDPEEADRLFDLFYRSPRTSRVSGSGIGLFVARRLVEAMGGSVWARPREDSPGAEFGVDLQPVQDDLV